ncbi:4-hydroxy-tetrahydrodipicolinate synthase [Apilactobacillus sp. TMW 2.2459]|uniref:4-hydroxy-tetrahydrodipicolinate synthase n=1 Tax=Apilactobacillus xinyiensis TaxID=2841032 RepID=UPI00200C9214|nr:4-hydroxy-tetrahydrodipicolinate synthase [Apilactobacillus xinyiensis]MCL0312027.1 4-hydroxy-tetrahydrodipicolinate synthase [Apilactobacillus xinyiensis]
MFENVDLMTAIITPFNKSGEIDYNSLEKLTNHLLETGSRGFVIGGTTGETPTLTHDEKLELYKKFAVIVNKRVPVIAGTGSNNTKETINFTQEVEKIEGIDAALVVVPYYNKPNQRCMQAHFKAVADNTNIPIAIYNIPGRTGVSMDKETIVELSKNPSIVGVKQCNPIEDIEYLVEHVSDEFAIYTGEDAQTMAAKSMGANGVISVASHVYGIQMRHLLDSLEQGQVKSAAKLQRFLTPKMNALFMYPSPSPVKAVLNAQGFAVGDCRLPILSLNDSEKQSLAKALNLHEDALMHKLSLELGD